jgi:hypothetical protein
MLGIAFRQGLHRLCELDQQGNFTIDPIHKDDANLGEKLYLAYTRTKKAWRRFTYKPVRKFRRFLKRKGKGRGKGLRNYLWTTSDADMQSFFQQHKKPYYGRSSGKGSRKGKHNNPQGKTQAQQDTTKLYFGKFRVKNQREKMESHLHASIVDPTLT